MAGLYKTRLLIVSALLMIFLLAVIVRLYNIQIIHGKEYALRSEAQVQKRIMVSAKRGDIYDRKGRRLATSVPGRGAALNLEAHGVENKAGQMGLQRIYPMRDLGGSVIGYVGKDGYGLGGIEFAFDHYLRGEDGWEMVHRDGRQRTYRTIGLPGKEPRDGSDIYLTIDVTLQEIVQSVLKQTVETLGAKGAMCIVMDPHTGKILAMADEPPFNPNKASSFSLAERQNKCISQIYEPGSTFKAITAAVALQEKTHSEDDLINSDAKIVIDADHVIKDDAPHGLITFTRALAVSSNVSFAQIAYSFSNDMFYRYLRDFGFGAKTGVSLPGEEVGILHPVVSPDGKPIWSGRSKLTLAFGHEMAVTFLQMMMAYASIANGGVLLSPVICEKVERKNGTTIEVSTVKPVRRVMSEETAARLRKMMKDVVDNGTGKQAAILGRDVAGKTGTSRKSRSKTEGGGYSDSRHWSSFIGFVPTESPTLLCGVIIDEVPIGKEGGGKTAAPAFREIVNKALANQELEFIDKLSKQKTTTIHDTQIDKRIKVPVFLGHTKNSATRQLDSIKIEYNFVGNGNIVRHQTPIGGSFMDDAAGTVILFMDDALSFTGGIVRVAPDCVGKDLRDAFNMMNASGIKVYAVGTGVVKKQSIAAGEILTEEKACTLFCSPKK